MRAAAHGQKLLALDCCAGGHPTHGYRRTISARLFDVYSSGGDPETKPIGLDALGQDR